MTTAYQEYMNSLDWIELREAAKARANYTCERCGAKAKEVHHKNYPDDFAHDHIDNLEVLCRVCHRAIHLEQKADRLARKLAAEQCPERIKLYLLKWHVEVKKFYAEGD